MLELRDYVEYWEWIKIRKFIFTQQNMLYRNTYNVYVIGLNYLNRNENISKQIEIKTDLLREASKRKNQQKPPITENRGSRPDQPPPPRKFSFIFFYLLPPPKVTWDLLKIKQHFSSNSKSTKTISSLNNKDLLYSTFIFSITAK